MHRLHPSKPPARRFHRRTSAAGFALAALTAPAGAEEAAPIPEAAASASRYVIGAAVSSGPEYAGSARSVLKIRPLWAYQYGRLRLSTSGAGAVLGFAADAPGPGASAELLTTDRLRLGAALRIDNGRRSSDSADLAGLPDIDRTLRGRLYASYALTDRLGISGNVSQDLLGKHGGALGSFDLSYRYPLGPRTELSAGFGIAVANTQYMQTYFGVTDAQAAGIGLPAFAPGAGLKDRHAGIGVTTALTPRWIAFATLGTSTLLGDAASSPLTKKATATGGAVGLAYRCCQ